MSISSTSTHQLDSYQHLREAERRGEEVKGLEHHGPNIHKHEEVVCPHVHPHAPDPPGAYPPTMNASLSNLKIFFNCDGTRKDETHTRIYFPLLWPKALLTRAELLSVDELYRFQQIKWVTTSLDGARCYNKNIALEGVLLTNVKII